MKYPIVLFLLLFLIAPVARAQETDQIQLSKTDINPERRYSSIIGNPPKALFPVEKLSFENQVLHGFEVGGFPIYLGNTHSLAYSRISRFKLDDLPEEISKKPRINIVDASNIRLSHIMIDYQDNLAPSLQLTF